METDGLVRALADRFRAVGPDGFHVTSGSDGTVWFSCDEGRFPGQLGNSQPETAGTPLRHNLLTVAGTPAERISAAAREALIRSRSSRLDHPRGIPDRRACFL